MVQFPASGLTQVLLYTLLSLVESVKHTGVFTNQTGTSYNFDKVCSGAPDDRFGKLFLIRDANNFD